MGGRRGSSTVATPPEVDVPGVAQKLDRPTTEGYRRGERQPAWPMGEADGRRSPQNRATSERCWSRGRGRGAMRCSYSRRCRKG
jgi:hypothetical protein